MPAEPSASGTLAFEAKRFRSAAEALSRQDRFEDSPFPPGRPSLLVWQAPRALLAAPGDTRLPGFEAAARDCAEAGWPVAARRAGGRVCPVSPGTLQLAISRPVAPGLTVETAYAEMVALIGALLARFGLAVEQGLCAEAFCPGRYDLAVQGRKIAGLAQAWRRHGGEMVAITGASLIVDEDDAELAAAVNRFYRDIPDTPECRASAIASLSALTGRAIAAGDVAEMLSAMLSAGCEPA